jgi:branched-subunit amino acid ABC-type transport system permease component
MSKLIEFGKYLLPIAAAIAPAIAYVVLHTLITLAIGKLIGHVMERYVFEPVKAENPEIDDALWERALREAGRPVVVK